MTINIDKLTLHTGDLLSIWLIVIHYNKLYNKINTNIGCIHRYIDRINRWDRADGRVLNAGVVVDVYV